MHADKCTHVHSCHSWWVAVTDLLVHCNACTQIRTRVHAHCCQCWWGVCDWPTCALQCITGASNRNWTMKNFKTTHHNHSRIFVASSTKWLWSLQQWIHSIACAFSLKYKQPKGNAYRWTSTKCTLLGWDSLSKLWSNSNSLGDIKA